MGMKLGLLLITLCVAESHINVVAVKRKRIALVGTTWQQLGMVVEQEAENQKNCKPCDLFCSDGRKWTV